MVSMDVIVYSDIEPNLAKNVGVAHINSSVSTHFLCWSMMKSLWYKLVMLLFHNVIFKCVKKSHEINACLLIFLVVTMFVDPEKWRCQWNLCHKSTSMVIVLSIKATNWGFVVKSLYNPLVRSFMPLARTLQGCLAIMIQ